MAYLLTNAFFLVVRLIKDILKQRHKFVWYIDKVSHKRYIRTVFLDNSKDEVIDSLIPITMPFRNQKFLSRVWNRLAKYFFYFLIIYSLILEREEGGREERRESHQSVVPPIHTFIGCPLCVPWLDIEPTTLAYQGDALTNWATWPGQNNSFKKENVCN